MIVTVFGASGKVGKLVVDELLAQGYYVQAFVHKHNPFQPHENLTIVKGDIFSEEDVRRALHKADAIVSTLGSWGTDTKDVVSGAIKNIIPEMRDLEIRRIVTLTGSSALLPNEKISIMHKIERFFLKIFGKKILADGELHIQLLAKSSLDWTVIRSPIMTNSGSQNFKLSNTQPNPFASINRAAVAQAIVTQLVDQESIRKAPHIVRSK